MTLTVADDCTDVLIESDYFAGTNLSVTLTVTKNCGDEYTIDIDTDETDYTVTPEDLDTTDVIDDGVYLFRLEITRQDSSVVVEQTAKFINCSTNCLMVNTFTNIGTDDDCTIKSLSYYALLLADECTNCTYLDMCKLYTAAGLNGTSNDSSCGCS